MEGYLEPCVVSYTQQENGVEERSLILGSLLCNFTRWPEKAQALAQNRTRLKPQPMFLVVCIFEHFLALL